MLMATFDGLGGVTKMAKGSKKVCGCRLTYVKPSKSRKSKLPQPVVKCPGRGVRFVTDDEAAKLERKGGENLCVYLKPTKKGKPCSKAIRKAVKMWCGIDPE